MLVVTPDDVGAAAFGRLIRDKALRPLTPLAALPADIPGSALLRAEAMEWAVPRRGVVSGLAALWVHGSLPGEAPLSIEVAVPRGANPDGPRERYGYTWSIVTEPMAVETALWIGSVRVAGPAAACVAALRRADHRTAIRAVMTALRQGLCTVADIDMVIRAHTRRGRGYERMLSAWQEIRACYGSWPTRVPGAARL